MQGLEKHFCNIIKDVETEKLETAANNRKKRKEYLKEEIKSIFIIKDPNC